MADLFHDLCKAFNLDAWSVDVETKQIMIDGNLMLLLGCSQGELSCDQFMDMIATSESKVQVAAIVGQFPNKVDIDLRIPIKIKGLWQFIQIISQNSSTEQGNQIKGFLRIEGEPYAGDKNLLANGSVATCCDNWSYMDSELHEDQMRVAVGCKKGMTYPFSLDLDTNLVKITYYDKDRFCQKYMTFGEFIESIHPMDRENYIDMPLQIQSVEAKIERWIFRSQCLSSDYRWYELLCDLLVDAQHGRPTKSIGSLRDIDEEKRNADQARQNVEFLSKMYSALPVGVEIYDHQGFVVDVNQKALDIFGIEDLSKIKGLSFFDDPGLPESFKEKIRKGEQVSVEIKYNLDLDHPHFESSRKGCVELATIGVPIFDEHDELSNYLIVHLDETKNIEISERVRDFENFFSAATNFARLGYCRWDILANKGFALDQWYLNVNEEPGSDLRSIIGHYNTLHPDDARVAKESVIDMLSGKINSIQQEVRITTKNGDYKRIYNNVFVTKYEPENNCIEVVGINIEITKLETIESELIDANNQAQRMLEEHQMVLNNLSTGLIYIDTNYKVHWKTVKALPGIFPDSSYTQGELCYKSAHNRDSPCEDCPFERMIITRKQANHQFEIRGSTIDIVANPAFDHKGNLLGGILKLENITMRKQYERQIKGLNQLMDTILDNVPVYIFVKNPNNNFRYLYWNKAMASHTMIPTDNVIGKTDIEVFPNAKDAERFRLDDLRLLEKGETLSFEEEFDGADGEVHTARTSKILIPYDGELPLVMGVSWDITEMKKNELALIRAKEKAEDSDRFKSSFLANMSHEIRTPLNAIVGFSELITDPSTDDEDRKEYSVIIQKNNQLLLQLISDILDLSRIEARALEFNYDQVDVRSLCSRIATSSSIKGAKVPIVFDEQLPECSICTDENRVYQIVTNFVTNAIKFTDEGLIEIGYRFLGDSEIEIYVKDTGFGIAADKVDSVFGRFVKLNSFIQGTGLGLSICKNLVEQFNGRIGVESQEGVGSRFWFTLPRDPQARQSEPV